MKLQLTLALLLVAVLFPACGKDDQTPHDARQVRTIEQEHVHNSRIGDERVETATSTSTENEVALPFEPPISMDPVDGSKVSIRRTTPSAEYEGKLYHFSSEENRTLFLEDPRKYVTGALGTY